MEIKKLISILPILLTIIMISLLSIYFFFPLNIIEFSSNNNNSDFNINKTSDEMQFYPNMRYASSNISYSISQDCSIQKQDKFNEAIKIIENLTILNFYEVEKNPEISVYCEETNKLSKNFLVVGEGGPTEIINLNGFNLINKGEVILIKEPNCNLPLVALHELFHALGFIHSKNEKNVMYNISNCKQTIGEDIPNRINELYSLPSNPDLYFENISLKSEGKYLNASLIIKNKGFADSEKFNLLIYADDKEIKEVSVSKIEAGAGKKINLSDLFLNKLFINKIKLEIKTNFDELNKNNNIKLFTAKNKI